MALLLARMMISKILWMVLKRRIQRHKLRHDTWRKRRIQIFGYARKALRLHAAAVFLVRKTFRESLRGRAFLSGTEQESAKPLVCAPHRDIWDPPSPPSHPMLMTDYPPHTSCALEGAFGDTCHHYNGNCFLSRVLA